MSFLSSRVSQSVPFLIPVHYTCPGKKRQRLAARQNAHMFVKMRLFRPPKADFRSVLGGRLLMTSASNGMRMQTVYANLEMTGYPQGLFRVIHTFHRVIHRNSRETARIQRIVEKVIPTVHRLSTGFMHGGVFVDKKVQMVDKVKFGRNWQKTRGRLCAADSSRSPGKHQNVKNERLPT